jgi:Skp family chaperone for outer membrane proteins
MKKTIFFALLAIFAFGAAPTFAANSASDNIGATETTLTTEEVNVLKERITEIREMDKSELTATEKSELKSELNEIKETVRNEPAIYIGGVSLLLLIILLVVLL